MHELGIATEIHRLCRAHISDRGPARLERVEVVVVELSAVEPELLRFAWEALTANGPDAGARLDIEWRAARQVCGSCGAEAHRVAGQWLSRCPTCDTPLRLEGGQELDVIRFSYTADCAREESVS